MQEILWRHLLTIPVQSSAFRDGDVFDYNSYRLPPLVSSVSGAGGDRQLRFRRGGGSMSALVVTADIPVCLGVVHIVDAVLLTPELAAELFGPAGPPPRVVLDDGDLPAIAPAPPSVPPAVTPSDAASDAPDGHGGGYGGGYGAGVYGGYGLVIADASGASGAHLTFMPGKLR